MLDNCSKYIAKSAVFRVGDSESRICEIVNKRITCELVSRKRVS